MWAAHSSAWCPVCLPACLPVCVPYLPAYSTHLSKLICVIDTVKAASSAVCTSLASPSAAAQRRGSLPLSSAPTRSLRAGLWASSGSNPLCPEPRHCRWEERDRFPSTPSKKCLYSQLSPAWIHNSHKVSSGPFLQQLTSAIESERSSL